MNSISLKRIMNLQGPHEISGTRGQALRSNLTNYLPGTGRPTNKRKVERGDRPPVPPQPTTSPDTGRPTSLVPVTVNATLNAYHRVLWSKELPNGEVMDLQSGKPPYAFRWKDFWFSSDTIIVEMLHWRNKKIVDQVQELITDSEELFELMKH